MIAIEKRGIIVKKSSVLVYGRVGWCLKKFNGNTILTTNKGIFLKNKVTYQDFIAEVRNMLLGVNKGYYQRLSIVGLGYRIIMLKGKILFRLGYTHYLRFVPVKNIIFIGYKNKIVLFGTDVQNVNAWASIIRAYKKRDIYKGKGIRYRNESIIFKVGKKR